MKLNDEKAHHHTKFDIYHYCGIRDNRNVKKIFDLIYVSLFVVVLCLGLI